MKTYRLYLKNGQSDFSFFQNINFFLILITKLIEKNRVGHSSHFRHWRTIQG